MLIIWTFSTTMTKPNIHDYVHMIVFVIVCDIHDYGYLVHQDMSYYFMFDAVMMWLDCKQPKFEKEI